MALYWPIGLLVLSNIFYHLCSKSLPSGINPFAALTVTYTIAAAVSFALFFVLTPGSSLLSEFRQLNWSSFVLGVAIVGAEAGSIYMYRSGWDISIGQLVSSALLSICLIIIGVFLYRESVSPARALGILICMVGLYFINR